MTWFTKVMINPQRREARKLLLHPEAMHAAVRASFPPDLDPSSRVLWRHDHNGAEHIIYMVSPEPPDPSHLVESSGWQTRPAMTADYQPLLSSLRIGQQWHFELVANPTHSLPQEHGKRGKIVAHVTANQQMEWLTKQGTPRGFSVMSAAVTERGVLRFRKGESKQHNVNISMARFRGELEITDTEQMRDTLINGMGRGKAYGCGLLTLAPLQGDS